MIRNHSFHSLIPYSFLPRRDGNMMAAAQQHRKKRTLAIRKTDAMNHAERPNGRILDQIWMEGDTDSFKMKVMIVKISFFGRNMNNL
jgi:hypothetical protein